MILINRTSFKMRIRKRENKLNNKNMNSRRQKVKISSTL